MVGRVMYLVRTNSTYLTVGCLSGVSVLTCIIAIVAVIFFKLYKYFIYRLASYQVLGALLWNVSMGLVLLQLYGKPHSVACQIEAFFVVYFGWIKLMFTTCLTAYIMFFIVCHKNLQRYELVYVLLSLLVPLTFCWVPFLTGNFGLTEISCFIDTEIPGSNANRTGIIELYSLYFGPLLVLMVVNMIMIVGMVIYVKRRSLAHNRSIMSSSLQNPYERYSSGLTYFAPLLAYPVALFLLLLVPLVFRAMILLHAEPPFALNMTASIAVAVIGLVAGLLLVSHICYAHVCSRASQRSVPFTTDIVPLFSTE